MTRPLLHIPSLPVASVPHLTTAQMVEVDRVMVDDLGITLVQMMEHAGRHLATLTRHRLGDLDGQRVTVLAGSGGNGGGAMVAARRLHAWGATVSLALTREPHELTGVPARQLAILGALGIEPGEPQPGDAVLDGIIGYSLRGAPRGRHADLIRWAQDQPAPVLSLDVPSGVDAGAGQVHDPAIVADATLTLALPKPGLARAREHVGELYLGDISVPPSVYDRWGLDAHSVFSEADLVRLS